MIIKCGSSQVINVTESITLICAFCCRANNFQILLNRSRRGSILMFQILSWSLNAKDKRWGVSFTWPRTRSTHHTNPEVTLQSPHMRRTCVVEDTSSERILKNKRVGSLSFPSSSDQMPTTIPHTLGQPARRETDTLSLGWMLTSVQKLLACSVGRAWSLETRDLADATFSGRAGQRSLNKRGNGLHFRAWWCWHMSLPIHQTDTTHGSEVWVILKNLHPNRLPGWELRDAPVIYQWNTGAEDYPWLPKSCNAHIQ